MIKQGRRAYVIAGEIGAGKSTASRIMVRNHGFQQLSYVDLIWRPILDRRGLPHTRHNLQELGAELLHSYGPVELARKILPYVPESDSFVIDDVRALEVFRTLKEAIPELTLVYVKVSDKVRRKRAIQRDGGTMHEQIIAESFYTECEISELQGLSDFQIVNDGEIGALEQQIKNIVEGTVTES